jgi:signal transduction histidine kinase
MGPAGEAPRRRAETSIGRILALSILLVTLIPFLPLGYLIWAGYRSEVAGLESEIQATNGQVARLAANYLESVLGEIREKALGAAADGDRGLPEGPPVVDWEFTDAACMVTASQVAPARVGSACGYAAFAGSLVEGRARVSQVGPWIEGRPPTVLLGVAGAGGKRRIAGVLKPEVLHERMTALNLQGADRHVYAVDEGGRLMFYSDMGFSVQGRDLRDNPPIRHFASGRTGPLRFTSVVSGKERLGFIERVPATGWGVIVSADVGPRLLGVRGRYAVIGWSALFAMSAALGILLWASRRLARPLLLIRGALAAKGRVDGRALDVPPDARGVREYDQLVAAYDGLSRRFAVVEKELIQAGKSSILGQLASGIAHEIGTPLNVISGNAQYLLRKIKEDDPAAAVLRMILKHTERITSMVQRLLDFSRPSEAQLKPVDLREVVSQTLEMASGMTRKLNVALDTSPALRHVAGDPRLLEHALLNLVINAAQAMPDGGRLGIEVGVNELDATHGDEAGRWVFVRVADTGCGIAPENLGRIFEPFFTTKAQGKGTGLGLAIVERIIRQHGGAVDVSSCPGAGAVFTIRLRPMEPGAGIATGGDGRDGDGG